MSSGIDCCTPCPTVQVTNVPGAPGPAGANGNDGINAFTFVGDPGFIVPAQGGTVTVPTLNCLWMAVGQNVEISGAGTFQVQSRASDGLSCSLLYLSDYTHNTHATDVITSGAQVSPAGTQPTFLPEQAFYAIGGTQNLTLSNVQLLSAVVTLPTAGKYMIQSSVRIDFNAATTMSSKTIFIKLRETTNGPADLANGIRELITGIVTGADWTLDVAPLPTIIYTATAGDTIQLQGSISSLLNAAYESGNVRIVEASILATPIA